MQSLYLICFGVGAGFTILSFILGHVLGSVVSGGDGADFDTGADGFDLDNADFDADFDTGIDGLESASAPEDGTDMSGIRVSFLKPSVISTFLTFFGAAGLLLQSRVFWYVGLIAAAAVGLAVAYAVFRFIIVPLNRWQNTSAASNQSLIGHGATVTEQIPQGGYGRITYRNRGNTYSSPAKSLDGTAITTHSAVKIVQIERNTYYVQIIRGNINAI